MPVCLGASMFIFLFFPWSSSFTRRKAIYPQFFQHLLDRLGLRIFKPRSSWRFEVEGGIPACSCTAGGEAAQSGNLRITS